MWQFLPLEGSQRTAKRNVVGNAFPSPATFAWFGFTFLFFFLLFRIRLRDRSPVFPGLILDLRFAAAIRAHHEVDFYVDIWECISPIPSHFEVKLALCPCARAVASAKFSFASSARFFVKRLRRILLGSLRIKP